MHVLSMHEVQQVAGGDAGDITMLVIGGWVSTVASSAVGYTMAGTMYGGLVGAGVGFGLGVLVGVGYILATDYC